LKNISKIVINIYSLAACHFNSEIASEQFINNKTAKHQKANKGSITRENYQSWRKIRQMK
jgi:hypothetical protein